MILRFYGGLCFVFISWFIFYCVDRHGSDLGLSSISYVGRLCFTITLSEHHIQRESYHSTISMSMRNARSVTQRNWYRLRILGEYYKAIWVACCFYHFVNYSVVSFFRFSINRYSLLTFIQQQFGTIFWIYFDLRLI